MTAPDFDAMRAVLAKVTPLKRSGQDFGWAEPDGYGGAYLAGPAVQTYREDGADADFIETMLHEAPVLLDWADGVRAAIEALHPVMQYSEFTNKGHEIGHTGCPTCRTDGPCPTRTGVTQ